MNVNELQQLKIKELAELAAKLQIDSYSGMNKQELIVKILEAQPEKEPKAEPKDGEEKPKTKSAGSYTGYKGDKDKNIQRVQVIKKVVNTGLKYEDFYDTIASWDKYGDQDYSTDFESE